MGIFGRPSWVVESSRKVEFRTYSAALGMLALLRAVLDRDDHRGGDTIIPTKDCQYKGNIPRLLPVRKLANPAGAASTCFLLLVAAFRVPEPLGFWYPGTENHKLGITSPICYHGPCE